MMRLALGVVALLCLNLLGPFARADAGLNVEIVARSSAVVDGGESIEAKDFLLSARLAERGPSDAFTYELDGTVKNGLVFRYEENWLTRDVGPEAYRTVPTLLPKKTLVAEGNFRFELVNSSREAAVALAGERLNAVLANGSTAIANVAIDPDVVKAGASNRHGARSGPNETHSWRQYGRYLVMHPAPLEGTGRGPLRVYWFQATVKIFSGEGEQVLTSAAWDERPAANPAGHLRHLVWFELIGEDSHFHVTAPATGRDVNTVLYAKAAELNGVDVLSLDSVDHVNGTLPARSERFGPSLWLAGDMQLELSTEEQYANTTSGQYRIKAAGTVESYAYGGKDTVNLDSTVAASTAGIVVLLALLLVFRDVILEIVGRGWLVLYSKLSGKDILSHSVRDLLYRAIEENPGIHYLGLKKLTELAAGTVRHHLSHLEKFGLITSQRVGRFRRYFLTTNRDARKLAALHQPSTRAIALIVRQSPGISLRDIQREIVKERNISMQGVAKQLKRLERASLVTWVRDGHRKRYEPTSTLRSASLSA